jgi:hypothetical protein
MDQQQNPSGSGEPQASDVAPQGGYPVQGGYQPQGAYPQPGAYPPQGAYQPQGGAYPPPGAYQPQGASGARLEPIGETWAAGVGPVRVGGRSSRFRWAIALGIVLIVALVTVGGAFVLSGAGGTAKSLTAGNAPKNTLMFIDLRSDLPGDQHQKLADFMSHFPGFKDRAQFDSAFDDILNRITGSISPDLTYTSAFKSWTTGEISVALTSMGDSTTTTTPSGAVIVALKDRAAGEAWVNSEVAKTGLTFTAQDYAGTKLYVGTKTTAGDPTAAYAFTDKVLLLGTVEAVKAGLDAPAKGSLADNVNYQAAVRALSGDSIATFYVDPQAIITQGTSAFGSMAGMTMSGAGLSSMMGTGSMPAWMVGSVRAESDHMTVEMTMPKTNGSLSPGNHESVVAGDLPGSTVGVIELHGVGKLVNDSLNTVATSTLGASEKDSIKQIQDALTQIGGIDWIGDSDIVVTKTGSTYGGGLVIKTPDAATASAKTAMVTTLIALGGGSLGVTSSSETYHGVTITKLHVAGSEGISLGSMDFAIAASGDLVVAGYGDAFVKAVLDTTPANSLASQSDFKTVMAAAGTSNAEFGYFNIGMVADELGQALFPANPSYYNLNYKPYVDHVGGAAFTEIDGSTVTLRLVFTAK